MAGEPEGDESGAVDGGLANDTCCTGPPALPDPAVVSGGGAGRPDRGAAGSQPVNAPGRLAGHLGPRRVTPMPDGATTRYRLRGQERDPGLLPGALILAGGSTASR